MLQLTNHPMVDVGVSVILNYFGSNNPKEITDEQLKQFAQYLEEIYSTPFFKSYLTVIFPNSAYVNANMKDENRRKVLKNILYGYLDKEHKKTLTCVFCGQPTDFRAYRQHIPLITGEGLINFFPNKRIGLETCPYCLLAIQAFPFGTLKVAGQAFLVHSDNIEITQYFVNKFMEINRKNLLITDKKEELTGNFAKTIFIDRILAVDQYIQEEKLIGNDTGTVTIYHFTNYGTKADIQMFYLPSQVFSFLFKLKGVRYRTTLQQMIFDGWIYKKMKKNVEELDEFNPYKDRNIFYEDIFDLPEESSNFIRKHVLGGVLKRFKEIQNNVEFKEGLKYWEVTQKILEDLLEMNRDRIEKTRQLADKIVDYLIAENDKKFFRQFYYASGSRHSYHDLRNLIIKMNMKIIQNGTKAEETLPVTFDDFIEVFEEWEDTSGNWRLARDLVLLRIMERLYQEKWFEKNKEILERINDEELVNE